jgi:DNA invertase Pin-like site-specific DNA recombinase
MSAIVYLRFSPRPPSSFEEDPNVKQRRLILEDCRRRELPIRVEESDSQASGADRKRPGLARAIAALKRGDELCVYDWKRLARDLFKLLSIAEDVKAKRCRLYSVAHGYFDDDKDMMRFAMSAMLGLFAQMERRDMAERTSRVMRRKQAEGWKMSKIPPYGKMIDPTDPARIIDNPEEQANIGLILELSQHCPPKSQREIARIMNADGIVCRENGFNKTIVASIIKRAAAGAAHPGK